MELKKAAEAKAAEERLLLGALYKPVVAEQKVKPGEDPSSIVCAFFKKNLCKKGARRGVVFIIIFYYFVFV